MPLPHYNLLLIIASNLESNGIITALNTNAVSSTIPDGINPNSARPAQTALHIAMLLNDDTATVRVVSDCNIVFLISFDAEPKSFLTIHLIMMMLLHISLLTHLLFRL